MRMKKSVYFNKTKITQKQKSMYKNLIINYEYLNVEDNIKKRSGGDEYNMLIITPEKYRNEIGSFMMWKNRKGLRTKLVTLTETGTTPTEIKDYITDEFNDNDIEYVLLVGNDAEIPTFEWGSLADLCKFTHVERLLVWLYFARKRYRL